MNIVTDLILPLALAFIMFSLGLGLTGSDFLRVLNVISRDADGSLRAFLLISIFSSS